MLQQFSTDSLVRFCIRLKLTRFGLVCPFVRFIPLFISLSKH
uniref:Uncharacterized protein n=1 Tax=Arundo donax TaxID=35708 RepID=A0A0A9APW7_ARUDO